VILAAAAALYTHVCNHLWPLYVAVESQTVLPTMLPLILITVIRISHKGESDSVKLCISESLSAAINAVGNILS